MVVEQQSFAGQCLNRVTEWTLTARRAVGVGNDKCHHRGMVVTNCGLVVERRPGASECLKCAVGAASKVWFSLAD